MKQGDKLTSTQLMLGEGSLKTSENPLDWAIQGEGFFGVDEAGFSFVGSILRNF